MKLKSKCTIKIEKVDIFIARTPGGGGYGNPLERSPELVHRDIKDGLVSPSAAKEDYGAADPSTTQTDSHYARPDS